MLVQPRPELLVAADGQHEGLLAPLQIQAQPAVRAGDLVAQHPGAGQAGLERAANHPPGQRRLGGESYLVGDGRLSPLIAGIAPRLGQVKLAVDQRVSLAACVGQEDADLSVLDPAVPLYWRATPTECSPFFRKPVSSTISTPSAAPRCSMTWSRHRSRAASWSHSTWLSTRCVRQGRASPICSASCQPFLRFAALSRPCRYRPACRLGSARTNCSPSRASSALNSSRQARTLAESADMAHLHAVMPRDSWHHPPPNSTVELEPIPVGNEAEPAHIWGMTKKDGLEKRRARDDGWRL